MNMDKPKKKWTWWKIVLLVFAGMVVLAAIRGPGQNASQHGAAQVESQAQREAARAERQAASERERMQKRIERQMTATGNGITSVSPTALYREYQSNEVAADNSYKSQWVQLKGRLSSVTKDLGGDAVLIFAADQYGVAQVHAELFDVQFLSLDKEQFTTCTALEKAATLRSGQTVLVEGLGAGSVLGMPMLKECLVVPAQ